MDTSASRLPTRSSKKPGEGLWKCMIHCMMAADGYRQPSGWRVTQSPGQSHGSSLLKREAKAAPAIAAPNTANSKKRAGKLPATPSAKWAKATFSSALPCTAPQMPACGLPRSNSVVPANCGALLALPGDEHMASRSLQSSAQSQAQLPHIQTQDRIWYCWYQVIIIPYIRRSRHLVSSKSFLLPKPIAEKARSILSQGTAQCWSGKNGALAVNLVAAVTDGNNHVASSLPACCLLHAPIPHKSDKKRMKDQIDTTHQLLQCKNAPQTHCRSRWLCSPDIGILQGFSTPRVPAFGLSLRLFLQEWYCNGW